VPCSFLESFLSPEHLLDAASVLVFMAAQPEWKISNIIQLDRDENPSSHSEATFKAIIKEAPIAIYELSYNPPRFIDVNDAMCRMSGYSREELLAMSPLALLTAESQQKFLERTKRALSGEQIEFNVEFQVIVKDGREITAVLNTTPLYRDGKLEGALVAGYDITERSKMERKLRNSQKRFQDLIETTGDFIWEMDTEGRYTYCSPQMEKLWGLKPADMLGKSPIDFLPPEHQKRMAAFISEKVASPEPFNGFQSVAFVGNNRVVYVETSGVPFFDNQGKLLGYRGITRDITERKKADEALRLSEDRFSKAFKNSPNAIMITRLSDGKIIDGNDSSYALFGYSQEEVIGKTTGGLAMWVYAKDRNKLAQGLATDGYVRNQEIVLRKKNGEHITVDLSAALITVDNQQCFISNFLDITECKKAQETLSRLNEALEDRVRKRTAEVSAERHRLYNVLETLPVYVVLLDKDYRAPFANKVFRERFGEAKGKRCYDFLFQRQTPCENCETYRALQTGKPHRWEWTGPDKRIYDVYDFPFVEGKGATCVLEMGIDITENKSLEKQLQEKSRLAAIGATAGMVGHDIRNPLQAITSDIYLAKLELSQVSDTECKRNTLESLNEIEKNIVYINKIVQDLQDYARPLKPAAKETNLQNLIEETIRKSSIPAQIAAQINIQKEAANAMTDPEILMRIIANLITNAVQAMPEGGKLEIGAAKQEETLTVYVQDNGVGIPDEAKAKLFTPLFTTKSKGQGFGLVVVKRMTEALGGSVSFESELGKGTKFILSLPLRK
jgi:PAS domain S-box-containing protein